jgi:hypothetical protein
MTQPQAPRFKPEVAAAVDGLVHLGYLEDTVEFCGHRFGIRTLYGYEDLLVGLLTKEYTETVAQAKAWTIAHVALALTHVDGQTDFCPPAGYSDLDNARGRFEYVARNWQFPTTDAIFKRFAALVARQAEAYEAMQDFSTRSLRKPSPSQSSLNEPGGSPSGTGSANQR